MSSFRFTHWFGVLALSALVACATTNPIDDDGGTHPDIDGSSVRTDADPMDPDAPMTVPDASMPCTPTTTNLLANPGFDLGRNVNWSEASTGGAAIVVTGA